MIKQPHKYEYQVQPNSAPARVVRIVGNQKRVLELGSGPGAVTRLLKDNGCRVTALEQDEEAIALVEQFCDQVYPCNLNDPEWPAVLAAEDKYDVIVAADVLEHLYDPWTTLSSLLPLLSENGYVVVSLPHAGHNTVIACLLTGDIAYQPWGLLDKTHIRFFGIKNIQMLFDDVGLKIIEAEFVVKLPNQTELYASWLNVSPEVRQALESNRFGTIYQVVVKAVAKSSHGMGLDLASVPVQAAAGDYPSGGKRKRLGAQLFSLLGERNQKRFNRLFKRLGMKH